jgi:Mn2+/Fe2+ NRAMP family transporter
VQEVEEDRKHGKTTVAVKMLFWRAIVNGVLAPPLVVLVVPLTSDKKVMGSRTNSRGAMVLGWICAAA